MSTATTHTGKQDIHLAPHERYVPQPHWRNRHDEAEAAKLGMWLFLSTEILLFSGFFCAYAVFRMMYPDVWKAASHYYLDWRIGALNTVVLLLSSYTVVMAIRAAQTNRQGLLMFNLVITQICALTFLVVKLAFEYAPKIDKGALPGGFFSYAHPYGSHDHIFMSIYWIATATHGVHVLVGVFVFGWVMWRAAKLHYGPKHYTSLENAGLYWHIVDIIWIFLFPLLYLV